MMKQTIRKICSVLLITCMTISLVLQYSVISSDASDAVQQTPEELGYSRITLEDFTKTEGTIAERYEAGTADNLYVGNYTGTSLSGTYLDVDISLSSTNWSDALYFGSTNGWDGISISIRSGELFVKDAGTGKNAFYDLVGLGLVDTINDEFNLKLGLKQGTDATYAIWIENVFVAESTFANTSATGTKLAVRTSTGHVTIKSAVDQRTPEYFGYKTRIDLDDFTKTEGTIAERYEAGTADNLYVGNYTGTSLSGTYLDVDISLSSTNWSDALYFGSTNGWDGISISIRSGELFVKDAGTGKNAFYDLVGLGLVDTINDEFNLKLGLKQGTVATYAIWVENVFVAESTFANTSATGTKLAVRTSTGHVTIKSAVDQRTPEYLGYTTKVTFEDFTKIEGTIAERYEAGTTDNLFVGNYTGTSLNGTYLDVDISISSTNWSDALYFGSTNGWNGIAISIRSGELFVKDAGTGKNAFYDLVGLGLVDTINDEFNLKLGLKQGTDATYAIWVENVFVAESTFANTSATGTKLAVRTSTGYVTIKTATGEEPPEEEPEETQRTPEDLGYTTKVSFGDFTLAEGTIAERYEAGTTDNLFVGNYTGTSLNGTYLDVDISISSTNWSDALYFGSTNGWNGIAISIRSGELFVKDAGTGKNAFYDLVGLGLVDTINDEFNLKLGLKQGTDATYAIWVENVFVAENTFTNTSATGTKLAVRTSTGYVTIKGVTGGETPLPPEHEEIVQQSPEELGYERITIGNFGWEEKTYSSSTGGSKYVGLSEGNTLNNKYLDVNITYSDVSSTNLVYASTGTWDGLRIYCDSAGQLRIQCVKTDNSSETNVYTIEQLGLESITKKFNLKLGVTFGDGFGVDGGTYDISYCLWINDVLVAKDVTHTGAKVGNCISSIQGAASMTLETPVETPFAELTASDFGVNNVTVKNKTKVGIYDENSLDATALTMMLQFSDKKGDSLYIGAKNAGVRLMMENSGNISVAYVNSAKEATAITTLSAKKVGVSSFTKEELPWRFTFRIYEEGPISTLKLAIYIDGVLYGYQDILVEGVEADNLLRKIAIVSDGGTFKVSTMKYEELTFNDFSIKDVAVSARTDETGAFSQSNYYDWASLDGTAFTGYFTFGETAYQDRIELGGPDWGGLSLIYLRDGSIWTFLADPQRTTGVRERTIAYLKPELVGLDTFANKELKIRLTFDVLQVDSDTHNLKLGIYINGKLYQDKHFEVQNADMTQLTRTLRVKVYAGPFKIASVHEDVDLSLYGVKDGDWKKALGLK